MFKITALLCVLAVSGNDLCMVGDIPTAQYYDTEEQCVQVSQEIGQAVNDEFIRRNIYISMQLYKIWRKSIMLPYKLLFNIGSKAVGTFMERRAQKSQRKHDIAMREMTGNETKEMTRVLDLVLGAFYIQHL